MSMRRKEMPKRPTKRRERQSQVELELPRMPVERPPLSKREERKVERGEVVIDIFGDSDCSFQI